MVKKNNSTRIYRITKFEHVLNLFETRTLHFSHPGEWEDPYETRLSHPAFDHVAAQCWCRRAVSDAMWRIYSPNQLGVRLMTTRTELRSQLTAGLATGLNRFTWKIHDVTYMSQRDIDRRLSSIEADAISKGDSTVALNALFYKRTAFEHEDEVRAVVYDRHATDAYLPVKVRVNPHDLIKNIFIDPRAPDDIAEMYTYYLRMKVKYRGKIQKSELYTRTVSA